MVVLDENAHLGGQRYRAGDPPGLKEVRSSGAQVLSGVTVLELKGNGDIWIEEPDGTQRFLHAERVVLAPGVRERFLPFPGWTLPGVLGFGALQVLTKSSGRTMGRVLFAGSGPLLLAAASGYAAHEGEVVGVADRNTFARMLSTLHPWSMPVKKSVEGGLHLSRLALRGRPPMFGWGVMQALGTDRVREVVLARVGEDGRFVPGTARHIAVDGLAIGHGFVPNTELARTAGCEMLFDAELGGFVVSVDKEMRTSRETIFAAGEITGVAGADNAWAEGELAGLAIAREFGWGDLLGGKVRRKLLEHRRRRWGDFGRRLARWTAGLEKGYADIPDETVICRCEDVTMGDIRRMLDMGLDSAGLLKRATRTGMGRCQGRTCGPLLNDILCALGHGPEQTPVRAPVKPARIAGGVCSA